MKFKNDLRWDLNRNISIRVLKWCIGKKNLIFMHRMIDEDSSGLFGL